MAYSRGKMRMTEVDLTSGDMTAPRFAQPPLVDTAATSMRLRVSTSEPATLHWAISYDNVAAEYRYQLLGFKTSKLSTQQVLDLSQAGVSTESGWAASGGRGGGRGGGGAAAAVRRRLQEATASNGTELREDGPIVAWGQWEVAGANEVVDLEITPPCISGTVMCTEHTDSLNPQTQYKVRSRAAPCACVSCLKLGGVGSSWICWCYPCPPCWLHRRRSCAHISSPVSPLVLSWMRRQGPAGCRTHAGGVSTLLISRPV